jgi:predicted lysophospholipase L1 biosynthesis ABC-type transport system permease subunit
MGYFDALTSAYFKTAQDGRKLFFPWGMWGRGYVIPSEQDDARLRRQMKAFTVISLALIVGVVSVQTWPWILALCALIVVFQLFWTRHLARGLQPSSERLSMTESITAQARAHGPVGLWVLEIASLVFVAGGLIILIADPDNWMIALGTIAFFGLCAAVFATMLALRGRASAPQP